MGTLYLCATPIGNLEDITLRVLRTLKEVDLIAAEDTRQTIKLLNHFDIKTPLTSYHEHNKFQKTGVLVNELLAGKTVNLPIFNFKTGKREYKDKLMTLGKDDVLVIEGIHGLNDKLSYSLPIESKFKIYISALTQLNIDEHNRIPSTDGRLIRRLVRDARTRGASATKTISMWPSVRRGEEKNIFPYQEYADVMFNSSLIYELAVLKQYVEPLLLGVSKDSPEYVEAKRLLKFLDYFVGIGNDNVPTNSLLREFIGGGCFHV